MQQALLILHVLVCIGVVVLVLLQQGRGADTGAAFGGGSSGSMFGSRGPTTFLTRATTILVFIFFITSLSLAWLSTLNVERRSVIERVGDVPVSEETVLPTEEVPNDGSISLPTLPEGEQSE